MSDVQVTHVPDRRRFAATVDGAPAGFASYVDRAGRRLFVHTEVDGAFGGQGVGSAIARAALQHAREEGLPVVPLCPFIAAWIDKHPDHADLVDEAMLAKMG